MNIKKIRQQIASNYDVEYLVDVLKLDSNDITERFFDKILDKWEEFEYVIDRNHYAEVEDKDEH